MAILRLVTPGVHGALVVELNERTLLGRHPDNDVQVLDRVVSKHHCRIERRDVGFYLVELGSLNGTMLNGRPITEARLYHNDEIQLGSTRYRFEDPGGPMRDGAVEDLRVTPRPSVRVRHSQPPAPRVEETRNDRGLLSPPSPDEYRRLRRYHELVSECASCGTAIALLQVLAKRLEPLERIERAALMLPDAKGELRCAVRWHRDMNTTTSELPENLIDHVLTEKAAVATHTTAGEPDGAPTRTALGLPLLWLDEVVGVLWVDVAGFWDLGPGDLDFLLSVARPIALMVRAMERSGRLLVQ